MWRLVGWDGRARAPPANEAGEGGSEDKEHAMSEKLNSEIAVIGIDIGKNSFHLVGQDRRGRIALRQKWSRGQVEARLAARPLISGRLKSRHGEVRPSIEADCPSTAGGPCQTRSGRD